MKLEQEARHLKTLCLSKMLRYAISKLGFMTFSMLILTPLTLMVWRGIWGIIDEYLTMPIGETDSTPTTCNPSTLCTTNISSENNLRTINDILIPGTHRIKYR